MLPTINGKPLLECTLSDLDVIIDNEDYRESAYIDYKKEFRYFDIPKGNQSERNREKAEIRKDICAFANAEGGYLVFGIKENGKGIPHEITGITIEHSNTDAFENDIKNILQVISPRIPRYEIRFLPFHEKYIVIIYVHHDYYAPYIFIENNQDYRAFKRIGNSVNVVTYMELKNMFIQSLSLEKEVDRFRNERADYYGGRYGDYNPHPRFFLFHIIPDTFLDSSNDFSAYAIERKTPQFSQLFQRFNCDFHVHPVIEGILFPGDHFKAESKLYNNGIVEVYYEVNESLVFTSENCAKPRLPWECYLDDIKHLLTDYVRLVSGHIKTDRLFACLTLMNCEGLTTEYVGLHDYRGVVDRQRFFCTPVRFDNIRNETLFGADMKQFELEYLLSLGIKYDKRVDQLFKELY